MGIDMEAVSRSLRALEQCDAIFGHLHMWEKVRTAMQPMIEQPNENRDAIVKDDETASTFVISVLARYVEQQIVTGAFHADRETLSFHGQSLRYIVETALSYLEERRAISHDDYLMRLDHLGKAVKKAGLQQKDRASGTRPFRHFHAAPWRLSVG